MGLLTVDELLLTDDLFCYGERRGSESVLYATITSWGWISGEPKYLYAANTQMRSGKGIPMVRSGSILKTQFITNVTKYSAYYSYIKIYINDILVITMSIRHTSTGIKESSIYTESRDSVPFNQGDYITVIASETAGGTAEHGHTLVAMSVIWDD